MDYELLKEYFYIDHSSPSSIRWKVSRRSSKNISEGSPAGTLHHSGYYYIRFLQNFIAAHRLVYLLHHGVIPENMVIDHINGVRSDNRIENLRLVTLELNNRNTKTRKDNKSGVKGVYFRHVKGSDYWVARYTDIKTSKRITKYFNIKYYKSIEHALEVATA